MIFLVLVEFISRPAMHNSILQSRHANLNWVFVLLALNIEYASFGHRDIELGNAIYTTLGLV